MLLDPAVEVACRNACGPPDMHGGQLAGAQQLVDGGASEAQDRRHLFGPQEQALRQRDRITVMGIVSRGHTTPSFQRKSQMFVSPPQYLRATAPSSLRMNSPGPRDGCSSASVTRVLALCTLEARRGGPSLERSSTVAWRGTPSSSPV